MQGNLFSGMNLSKSDMVLNYLINNKLINHSICKKEFDTDFTSRYIKRFIDRGIAIKKIPRTSVDEWGTKRYWLDYVLEPYEKQPKFIKQMLDMKQNAKGA